MMHPPSILLVDDEVVLLDLFTVGLRGLPNPILRATGGREALQLLEKERPALVILDLAMPDVDGQQVLASIRNTPKFAATKVIVLTAVPIMIDYQIMNQADQVLTKPIKMRDLQQAVITLLEVQ